MVEFNFEMRTAEFFESTEELFSFVIFGIYLFYTNI